MKHPTRINFRANRARARFVFIPCAIANKRNTMLPPLVRQQTVIDFGISVLPGELERMGITYETMPQPAKPECKPECKETAVSENPTQAVGEVVPEAGIEPATKGL